MARKPYLPSASAVALLVLACNQFFGLDPVQRGEHDAGGASFGPGGSESTSGGSASRTSDPRGGNDSHGLGSGGSAPQGGATNGGVAGSEPGSGAGGDLIGNDAGNTGGGMAGWSADCKEAGPTPEKALDMGVLDGAVVPCIQAFVSTKPDFFAFELLENATLQYRIVPRGDVRFQIHRNTGITNLSEPVEDKRPSAYLADSVLLEKGSYYIEVSATDSVLYNLDLSAEMYVPSEPVPEPGDRDAPLNVGELTEQAMTYGGYVGKRDDEDVYQFEMPRNARIVFSLSNVQEPGSARAMLYDLAAPPVLLGQAGASSPPVTLEQGTYVFIVTTPAGTNSLYTLSFAFAEE